MIPRAGSFLVYQLDGLTRALCPSLHQWLPLPFSQAKGKPERRVGGRRTIQTAAAATNEESSTTSPVPAPSQPTPRRKNSNKLPPPPPVEISTQLTPQNQVLLKDVVQAIRRREYPGVFQSAVKAVAIANSSDTESSPSISSPTAATTSTAPILPDAELYSLLIEACAHFPGCLMQPIAKRLFYEMTNPPSSITISNTDRPAPTRSAFRPTSLVYHSLLKLLSSSPDYLFRLTLIREMKSRWFEITPQGWCHIVRGFLRDQQFEMALEIVETKLLPHTNPRHHYYGDETAPTTGMDPETWEDLVVTLSQAGEVDEAYRLMRISQTIVGLDVGRKAWYHLLFEASRLMHRDATVWTWRYVYSQSLFPPDDGLLEHVLLVAVRYGEVGIAGEVLRFMARRGTPFGSMPGGFRKEVYAGLLEMYLSPTVDQPKHTFAVLKIMARAGVDIVSSGGDSLRKGMVGMLLPGGVRRVVSVEEKIREALAAGDILSDLSEGTGAGASVDGKLVKQQKKEKIREQKAGKQASCTILTVLISAYSKLGELKRAWEVYKLFGEYAIRPGVETFNALLAGCALPSDDGGEMAGPGPGGGVGGSRSQESLKKEFAMYVVHEMSAMNIPPDVHTYEHLIIVCLNHAAVRLPPPPSPTQQSTPSTPSHPPHSSSSTSSLASITTPPAPPDPTLSSLNDALSYLYEMSHYARLRPRQRVLRKVVEVMLERDDDRLGRVLEEMEGTWGYIVDKEREMVAGLWKRVVVDVYEMGMIRKGGERVEWVRCGRRRGR